MTDRTDRTDRTDHADDAELLLLTELSERQQCVLVELHQAAQDGTDGLSVQELAERIPGATWLGIKSVCTSLHRYRRYVRLIGTEPMRYELTPRVQELIDRIERDRARGLVQEVIDRIERDRAAGLDPAGEGAP